jgi:hypothetical protein
MMVPTTFRLAIRRLLAIAVSGRRGRLLAGGRVPLAALLAWQVPQDLLDVEAAPDEGGPPALRTLYALTHE